MTGIGTMQVVNSIQWLGIFGGSIREAGDTTIHIPPRSRAKRERRPTNPTFFRRSCLSTRTLNLKLCCFVQNLVYWSAHRTSFLQKVRTLLAWRLGRVKDNVMRTIQK